MYRANYLKYTWSYTILGNNKADVYFYDFFNLCQDHITSEEDKEYSKISADDKKDFTSKKLQKYLPILFCKLVERCYDELIEMALSKDSRFAFQVLGYFLMSDGSKMTDDLKLLILENSRWIDDRRQLTEKKDRIERRKYLFDFREKILKYKSGKIIKIPYESATCVAKRVYTQEKRAIDEFLKKKGADIEAYIQRTPILQ